MRAEQRNSQPVARTPTPLKQKLWFNVLVLVGVCVALYITIFASLSFVTQHGAEVKVLSVKGRLYEDALKTLKARGFTVEVDSSYEPGKRKFEVLAQQPQPGAIVKEGRTLFITINRASPPETPMPNLVNLSFRSAAMILKSNRLVLGDTILRPDIARGAVLEQLYAGKQIIAGTMLPQGSKISLVIGDGLGQTEFSVPDVIGMSYFEGRELLSASGLYSVPVFDFDVRDSASAIIYNQSPSPYNEGGGSNRIRQGDYVDLFIKQSPSPEEMEMNRRPPSDVQPFEEPAEF